MNLLRSMPVQLACSDAWSLRCALAAFLFAALAGCSGGGGSDEEIGSADELSGGDSALIFADDFESEQPVGERYFEYLDNDGDFVRLPEVGYNGSHGMRVRWQAGEVDGGNLKRAFGRVPAGLGYASQSHADQDFREIYWRLYLRNEPGWTGNPDKLTRAISFGGETSWAEAIAAHVWSSTESPVLVLDPASGTDEGGALVAAEYNDSNLRWLGVMPGHTQIFAEENAGKWYFIEAHVKLNSPGASDGIFEMWIDGVLEAGAANLNWVGSWQDYGINAIFVENYWNAGAPGERVRYIDNLVISTERIGCL